MEASTNMVFSSTAPVTTTFNASECKGPKTIVYQKFHEVQEYVVANMDPLATQIAAGQGELVTGLAELMQISINDRARFNTTLQKNFRAIYPSTQVEAGDVVDQIVVTATENQIVVPIADVRS